MIRISDEQEVVIKEALVDNPKRLYCSSDQYSDKFAGTIILKDEKVLRTVGRSDPVYSDAEEAQDAAEAALNAIAETIEGTVKRVPAVESKKPAKKMATKKTTKSGAKKTTKNKKKE